MVKELVGKPHAGSFFSEFPPESEWDVVVIGAGPNGLITAAYLAKAGLKVCLVERRYEIGGGLATEEVLYPGLLLQHPRLLPHDGGLHAGAAGLRSPPARPGLDQAQPADQHGLRGRHLAAADAHDGRHRRLLPQVLAEGLRRLRQGDAEAGASW